MANKGLDLSVDLAPKNARHFWLKNPILIASGTFGYDGYGRGIPADMDLGRLGAVIPKTVTRWPREGNPEPRWYPKSFREGREAGECVYLNSIGLTNPGIEAALDDLAPVWDSWDATVILSLSATTTAEFGQMAALTRGVPGFGAIELNLSCPNVEQGALFCHSPELTGGAVAAVRAHSDLPIIAKLGPNVPDIAPIALSAEENGADALTISNTMPAMLIDPATSTPVLGNITGGLSGPGLFPISLALVYRAAQVVRIPIMGVGGVFSAKEALQYFMAGASAIQIGSANLADLWAPIKILNQLEKYLSEQGLQDLNTITGSAQAKALAK